jgi:hypothetical protein
METKGEMKIEAYLRGEYSKVLMCYPNIWYFSSIQQEL